MAGFFDGIRGSLQDPVGEFNNGGPLPSSSMYGSGPLGRFNQGSELLRSNMGPYDGQDASFSQQPAYLDIPHSIPKVLPRIRLPSAQGNLIDLTRSVNYGDLAFSMRVPEKNKKHVASGNGPSQYPRDPIINLATVNYLLHGLQEVFEYSKNRHDSSFSGTEWDHLY